MYAVGADSTNGTGGSGDPECNVHSLTPTVLLTVKEGKTLIAALTRSYADYSEYSAKATTIE